MNEEKNYELLYNLIFIRNVFFFTQRTGFVCCMFYHLLFFVTQQISWLLTDYNVVLLYFFIILCDHVFVHAFKKKIHT